MLDLTKYEAKAYELGADHAKAVASWVIDGNTSQESIRRVVALLDDGADLDDYLPRMPNLSGEYADDLTPAGLARAVTGLGGDDLTDDEVDAMADAYEAGVADTFEAECERILRAAVH